MNSNMNKPCKKCGLINRNQSTGACRTCKATYDVIWKTNNRDKVKVKAAKWRANHPTYITTYSKNRYNSNIQYRLAKLLRVRIRDSLKNQKLKTGSAVRDLGCSIEELKIYLEKRFQPHMSWENQGQWHIDHIIPLSKFDLTNREQLLKACHFTNLQPLWAKDNKTKGATEPDRATLP